MTYEDVQNLTAEELRRATEACLADPFCHGPQAVAAGCSCLYSNPDPAKAYAAVIVPSCPLHGTTVRDEVRA